MIFAADCLREKTALVTGASSGLGEHFALTLARHGARVVLAARRRDRLDKLAKKIGDGGGTAFAVALDVRDPASVGAAVEAAARVAGPLTVLVNNAGIAIDKPLLEQSEQDWNDVL
ncbi:MAG TPA: SDR family NAD(P)-dependent oxidoreductase, partial [Burkholderiales bacterium]|nr:SDR family NAD(P)-dependent oxidoreductase [Burkholderiales bacterium]